MGILGFQKHGLKFFSLLVPAGCPLGLLPLLVTIEFISYLARNVSLGLRLAANITAGHMLLSILSGFVYNNEFRNNILYIRFNTIIIYNSIFRIRISYSIYSSTSICSIIIFIYKRWTRLKLKKKLSK